MRQGGWREGGAGEWAKQEWRYFFPVLWDNSGPGDVVSHGVQKSTPSQTPLQLEGGFRGLCHFCNTSPEL